MSGLYHREDVGSVSARVHSGLFWLGWHRGVHSEQRCNHRFERLPDAGKFGGEVAPRRDQRRRVQPNARVAIPRSKLVAISVQKFGSRSFRGYERLVV